MFSSPLSSNRQAGSYISSPCAQRKGRWHRKKPKRIFSNYFNNKNEAALYTVSVGAFETAKSFLVVVVECCFMKR